MEWLRSIQDVDLLYHSLVALAIVVGFYLLSSAAKRFFHWIGHKIIYKTSTDMDDRILTVVLAYVKPLMLLTGLHIALREIRKGVPVQEATLEQILDYGGNILYIVFVILVVRVFLAIIRVIIDWYLEKVGTDEAAGLKRTLGPLASKAANIIIGMVAMIIILDHFGVNIGSLLVSLGVGSLAVALAAQDTLANMIAGFVILIDRPYRVGDRIELASGHVGDVQEIGLRSTKLLNFDANLIIIPNAEMVKSRIVNYAYPHNQMRIVLKFNIAYGTDAARVRRVLLDLVTRHPDVLQEPPPEVVLTGTNDWALEFTLIARASDFSKKWSAEVALREQAYEAFRKEDIEIPFPHHVIQMKHDT